jgi:surfeit locus 1 family protein
LAIRIANRRFAPSFVGTVLVLVGVALFVQLGLWQLRRADEKERLQSAVQKGQQTTVTLTAENLLRLPRYQHVAVSGRFDSARQVLLDNMPSSQGRPGFRVLTPFVLEWGATLLVDRGWIPMGDRRQLPANLSVDETLRRITGRLDLLPAPGIRMGSQAVPSESTWPRVMNFPQHLTVETAYARPIEERILLLDPSMPHGFERQWDMRSRFSPNKHLGYAVQWFAFALCAVVIYVLMSFKRVTAANND